MRAHSAIRTLELAGLSRSPAELWTALLRFGGPAPSELAAMRGSVDVLFPRGQELVVRTYEHLARVPETARILGWEQGIAEEHLAERRRFFTIWLARALSVDLGTDFAGVLHRAGQMHAGHGPRGIHTPREWVTASMGLVLGAFSEFLREARDDAVEIARALSGWNKYLMMQLALMHVGYDAARALDDGESAVTVRAYGRVRESMPSPARSVRVREGETVGDLLRKLLEVVPELREMVFSRGWRDATGQAEVWPEVEPLFELREGWRILHRGKDVRYGSGFGQVLVDGDVVDLFPPGR